MTRILGANYFSWNQRNIYGTDNLLATVTLDVDLEQNNPDTDDKGSVMPTAGLFVGLIVHVSTNNATKGLSRYRMQHKTFSSDYATTSFIMDIDIPFGETGCFYSDPDLSEGIRTYEQYDILQLVISHEDTQSVGTGTNGVSLVLGIETKVGNKTGPYFFPLNNDP